MPLYEYCCPKCKTEVELMKSIKDESLPLCCNEECGAVEMDRIISRSSFHLKGLGWAAEGYDKSGAS